MRVLSALIVDDEAPARSLLRELLEQCNGVEVVAEAASGTEALAGVDQFHPDVVFLDVQMPELDGLDTARRITGLDDPPRIVFVTAYDEYALKAFEVEAVDYLLKPVEPARLEQTVGRLLKTPGTPTELERLVRALAPAPLERLALLDEQSGVRHVVDLAQVVYVTADKEKTYVRLPDRFLRCMETLGGLEQRLPPERFFRTHRSYLVNLERISRVEPWGSGAYNMELEGSDRPIPLSRHYAPAFKQKVAWL